jgi:large subunit ribosomal protein L13
MANETKKYQIDAAGKTLGRVASEAAKALIGKKSADYTPHIRSNVQVTVSNAAKMYTREKKRTHTILTHYTGFHGGLKKISLGDLIAKKGHGEAIRRAVKRMLPRNTMHTARMKNLIISE